MELTETEKTKILAEQKALGEYLDSRCLKAEGADVRKAISMALLHEASHGMINAGCPVFEAMREFLLFLEHAVDQRNENASPAIMEVIERIFQPPTPKEDLN